MGTTRLNDRDRHNICDDFRILMNNCLNSKPFPIHEEEFNAWGLSLLPAETLRCWKHLKIETPDLASGPTRWRPEFKICDDEREYRCISNDGELPYDGIMVPRDDERWREVIAWCQWYVKMDEQRTDAKNYIELIVKKCHSIGQIKRVLPDEILRFVPDSLLSSLKGAERQSRLPRGFYPISERMENLANVLAIAGLSPDKREGLSVEVSDHSELNLG